MPILGIFSPKTNLMFVGLKNRIGMETGTTHVFHLSLIKIFFILHDIITVIHLQFWAYGSWDSLFPISMSPSANS